VTSIRRRGSQAEGYFRAPMPRALALGIDP